MEFVMNDLLLRTSLHVFDSCQIPQIVTTPSTLQRALSFSADS